MTDSGYSGGAQQTSSEDDGPSNGAKAAMARDSEPQRRTRSSSSGGARGAASALATCEQKIRAALRESAEKKTKGGEKEADVLGPHVRELNPPHMYLQPNRKLGTTSTP